MCVLHQGPVALRLRQIYSSLISFGGQSEITLVEIGSAYRQVNWSALRLVCFESKHLLIESNRFNPGCKIRGSLTRAKRIGSRAGRKISIHEVMCDQPCNGIKLSLVNEFKCFRDLLMEKALA